MYATDIIYSDLNIKQIESLTVTQPHRSVDITVTNADKEGKSGRVYRIDAHLGPVPDPG